MLEDFKIDNAYASYIKEKRNKDVEDEYSDEDEQTESFIEVKKDGETEITSIKGYTKKEVDDWFNDHSDIENV